jgi:hypothetical protein
MDSSEVMLSVFTAVEGAHAFSAFMPSWFTIQKFSSGEEDTSKLRSGYLPAIVFNIIIGATVSYITKRPWPMVIALLVILFMVGAYEGAIGKEAKNEK